MLRHSGSREGSLIFRGPAQLTGMACIKGRKSLHVCPVKPPDTGYLYVAAQEVAFSGRGEVIWDLQSWEELAAEKGGHHRKPGSPPPKEGLRVGGLSSLPG